MKYIDVNTPIEWLQAFLESLGWITNEYVIKISTPGAGNMNVVVRVETDRRAFILKQSRPFVQKYPDLAAPVDRIDVEFQFHKATRAVIKQNTAGIIQYAPEHYLIMMEDLGDCEDMVSIYQQRTITKSEIKKLVAIAQNIHSQPPPKDYPINQVLRELNHQHIFVLPFMNDNGFQLDDVQGGLQSLSLQYKNNTQLKSVIAQTGDRYLSNGMHLIHGDYYPGSWMKAKKGLFVIDAEFSFIGFKEFDLGVMAGHLMMTTSNTNSVDVVANYYGNDKDVQLIRQVAGIEIMRRLIGLAQLPLDRTLDEKSRLLEHAREMIMA